VIMFFLRAWRHSENESDEHDGGEMYRPQFPLPEEEMSNAQTRPSLFRPSLFVCKNLVVQTDKRSHHGFYDIA